MKIMGIYLPQYHEIKENNEWWGRGYTEWNAVKEAKPLFHGHIQPREPLNENYYDLVEQGIETWNWQAQLAEKYGIYGFCIYHYWFEGKQLLERPMEILRDHPEINIKYCVCWANESWRKNWYGEGKKLLVEQTYGNRDKWEKHFHYLLSFFQDERYIKIDNKPIVNIYKSGAIQELPEMLEVWNHMAKKAGFDGVYVISALTPEGQDNRDCGINAYYHFEPGYTLKKDLFLHQKMIYLIRTGVSRLFNKIPGINVLEHKISTSMIYKHIENRETNELCYPGTFPQWDNTPRTAYQGLCYTKSSPEMFQKHLKKIADKYKHSDDIFLYINAWNEWGEGAYLEPDAQNRYGYLEAVKSLQEG